MLVPSSALDKVTNQKFKTTYEESNFVLDPNKIITKKLIHQFILECSISLQKKENMKNLSITAS